ncbi:hypothetical protein H2203_003220 [Taxawa tesnikishii (nom. ined.)]|nr:hypothetical protein H2203_003220 [Dothideales sp. JES 119]
MQFKTLAVLSLSAAAMAAPEAEKRQATFDTISVLQVLQTALPSSLYSLATANPLAASSVIASEFSAGATPSWYSALPSDIQTLLNPVVTGAANASSITSAIAGGITSAPAANTSALGVNSTAISASQSAILASIHAQNSSAIVAANGTAGVASASGSGASTTSSGSSRTSSGSSSTSGAAAGSSASSSGSSSGSSTSSSAAGASMPTAIYGMGLAGAVGLVGLLAL